MWGEGCDWATTYTCYFYNYWNIDWDVPILSDTDDLSMIWYWSAYYYHYNTEMLSIMTSHIHCCLLLVLTVILHLGCVNSVELTFELPDSAKECFHEIIEKDTESTLEFQVRTFLYFLYFHTDWFYIAGCYWWPLWCRCHINWSDAKSFI